METRHDDENKFDKTSISHTSIKLDIQ